MALLLLVHTGAPGAPPVVVPPAVVINYCWRRVIGDTGDGVRIETSIPNGRVKHWTFASGGLYEFRAEAVGDNGTSAFSEWT